MSSTAECALRVMSLRRSFVFRGRSPAGLAFSLVSEWARASYWAAQ